MFKQVNQLISTYSRVIAIIALMILGVWLVQPTTASAQTPCSNYSALTSPSGYTIGTVDSNLVTDLRAAMECANANTTASNLINLNDQTVTLTDAPAAYDFYGYNGLPVVKVNLTIMGGEIERASNLNCTFVEDEDPDRTDFRLMQVSLYSGDVTLQNMTLRNGCAMNAITPAGDYGGAIMSLGSLHLNAVDFENNAARFGGAVYSQKTLSGANGSFIGNRLIGHSGLNHMGAAIGLNGSPATLANMTFSQHHVPDHSVIYVREFDGGVSNLSLINSTLTSNTVGEGVIVYPSVPDGSQAFNNVVLANNTGGPNCSSLFANIVNLETVGSYSDDGSCDFDSHGGVDNAAISLEGLATATNGTQYHALVSGDGFNGGVSNQLPTETALGIDVDQDGTIENSAIDVDQLGNPRVQGTAIEAGAVEASCSVYDAQFTTGTGYQLGTVRSDLAIDLRWAIDCANGNGTDDIINLNGQTVILSDAPAAYDDATFGYVGLPPIANSGSLKIHNGTIERDASLTCSGTISARTHFRLLKIDDGADATLENVTLRNGCAAPANPVTYGGAAWNEGTLRLNAVHLEGNTAVYGGAILNQSQLIVANSSFVDNTVYSNGSATDLRSAVLNQAWPSAQATVVNSTISQNAAGTGHYIIDVEGGALSLINSTITNNTAGQAVRIEQNGTFTAHNTMIAGNTVGNCSYDAAATIVSATGSFSNDNSCQFGSYGGTDAAGVTFGALTSAANGTQYHRLLGVGVNAGTNSLLPTEAALGIDVDQNGTIENSRISVDQTGASRIVDNVVDAGASEVACATYNADFASGYTVGTIIADDLVADLRHAIVCANSNGTNDIIDLASQTVTLADAPAAYDNLGANGLPAIEDSGTLTIQNGTIERDSSYTSCDETFSDFRFFYVQLDANLTLSQLTLQNGCAGTVYDGGAIYNKGTVTLSETGFHNNMAVKGGAVYNRRGEIDPSENPATMNIGQSLFSGNSAVDGGAIYNAGVMAISNSTVSGNHATSGGGIYASGDEGLTLHFSTIVSNTATTAGGLRVNLSANTLDLAGNIIANNTGGDCQLSNGTISGSGYNLIADSGGNACGLVDGSNNNLIGVDPLVEPLADNGGSTETHLLLGGSRAFNAVPAASCSVTTDQRGQSRPGYDTCDIGAVEMTCAELGYAFPYSVGTINSDHVMDLRSALTCANLNGPDDDTITLSADITLSDSDNTADGSNGLPVISSSITLDGDGFTLARDTSFGCGISTVNFRHFNISSTGTLNLSDITLQNGCASGVGDEARGGAIRNVGTLQLSDTLLLDNTALDGIGGALYSTGTLAIVDSTLRQNESSGGGAIANAGSGEITRTTISHNVVNFGSGGGIQNSSNLTLTNSTVSNNDASTQGGGILNETGANLNIRYSTVAANDAQNSGGIDNDGGQLTLTGALLADNFASGIGGYANDCVSTGTIIDGGHNLIENANCLSHNVNGNLVGVDPQLQPLANNGGGTQTHALLNGSPPVDAADNATCPADDQRQLARPADADGDGSATCDIGAFEIQTDLIVSNLGDGDDGDYSYGELTLREAIANAAIGSLITFDASLSGGTIQLVDSELVISQDVTIRGTVPITVSAAPVGSSSGHRVLRIAAGEVNLERLRLTHGSQNRFDGPSADIGGTLLVEAGAVMTMTHSMLTDGIPGAGAFGALGNRGRAIVLASTIANNEFPSLSGGIFNSGEMLLENSTISGNASNYYAGIFNNSTGHLTMLHTTVADNESDPNNSTSGAISNFGVMTMTNSIIANATVGNDCYQDPSSGTFIDGGHNLIEGSGDNACGLVDGVNGNIIGVDPLLDALGDYGGDTQTLALLAGSPAIDAGDNADCTTVDQRGESRTDWLCDIGAYELMFSDSDTVSKTVSTGITVSFGGTLVKATVVNDGGCLTGITVQRVPGNHPSALTNIQTGRYWTITPTPLGCSGFDVTLTLPYDVTSSSRDKACRYTGSGWDCGTDGENTPSTSGPAAMPNIVTRTIISQFSDWAVGAEVGPTAVSLQSLNAVSGTSWGMIGLVLLLAATAVVVLTYKRRYTKLY